ncbi:MAG: tripartite tricarboxylate transporter TctB family protein [Sporomusaceae bacterium]|nr:tripartite tricarboxylate transporter TctB family protein [Sporomusaceae bacterium]
MRNAGIWAGLAILGFAAVIFSQSLELDYSTRLGPGPGFFPLWLSGILIVLAICYLWSSFKREVIDIGDILPRDTAARRDILMTVCGVVIFPLVVDDLGFVISGSILLFIMFMRAYKWYMALGISVATSLLLFFIFQSLLGVSLPVNEFGW